MSDDFLAQCLLQGIRDQIFGAFYYLQNVCSEKLLCYDRLPCFRMVGGGHEATMKPKELVEKVACLLWLWGVLDDSVASLLPNIVAMYMSGEAPGKQLTYWEEDSSSKERMEVAICLPYMREYNKCEKQWAKGTSTLMDRWISEEKQSCREAIQKLHAMKSHQFTSTMRESIDNEISTKEKHIRSYDNIGLHNPCLIHMLERKLKDVQERIGMAKYNLWDILPHLENIM